MCSVEIVGIVCYCKHLAATGYQKLCFQQLNNPAVQQTTTNGNDLLYYLYKVYVVFKKLLYVVFTESPYFRHSSTY